MKTIDTILRILGVLWSAVALVLLVIYFKELVMKDDLDSYVKKADMEAYVAEQIKNFVSTTDLQAHVAGELKMYVLTIDMEKYVVGLLEGYEKKKGGSGENVVVGGDDGRGHGDKEPR
ncbi:hypothetical protein [uncultured Cohaesibacter sp.]|uniref:hypothetical protein n=1 Tax=uncultured Cohaesibacter sp. TaxID=1002546 RepID=UPI0029C97AF3|nr:hypothetical protein [uncultured Cohaesibacter sp.]